MLDNSIYKELGVVPVIHVAGKETTHIAKITGAETGMVTSGTASGVVLSIAACMTGTDIAKIRQLPNALSMKNKLIVQKIHVGSYSYMYTFPRAKLIEVGNANDCLADLR